MLHCVYCVNEFCTMYTMKFMMHCLNYIILCYTLLTV